MRNAAQAAPIEISVRASVIDHLRDLERGRDPHLVEHMVSALLGFSLNLDRNAEAEFQRRLRATLVKVTSSACGVQISRHAARVTRRYSLSKPPRGSRIWMFYTNEAGPGRPKKSSDGRGSI